MQTSAGTPSGHRLAAGAGFSTDYWPEADRLTLLRDIVGPEQLRLEIEPLTRRFRVEGNMQALPGLNVFRANCPPVQVGRTAALLSDGNDDLIFQWADAGGCYAHRGREVTLAPRDAILLSCADPFSIRIPSEYTLISLRVSRRKLGVLVHHWDDCLARPVPANSRALRLLLAYLNLFRGDAPDGGDELSKTVADHVYDLVAISLGATGDAAEMAKARGVCAARFQAIKNFIRENLADGDLSISGIAARFRLTPRSIQSMFERESTTFTGFVREQRLARAYRMLESRQLSDHRIADIALACGFGDISTFNRIFRTRFGATPSDVRNGGRG